MNPDDTDSAYNLGHIYENKKDYQKALKYNKKVIEINPKQVDAQCRLRMVYIAIYDKEMALEQVTKLRKLGNIGLAEIVKQGIK
ncbi:MAG: hypothetical protein A2Y03_04750 [Omnitrophica WOR_2 bacterium GWF2_38_59]|nr:MAG: hypothetical protein A2Y06_02215 [Omnitrophica WOR_2 bacterium GWA2_37_7]OGX25634.1 MAG: hypothetical protein A2Y03_04750 [Omnitrophica WOR_2 bacterium GWF2_38_59]OGX48359.1 MAG: hypothetical protein A2243_07920 [Omnitrophica WOR_2 bacterium RIFOXYA2_FULL_38_17]OGX54740.1 MAG: hypothetical protein A2267_05970 [Omnitrophica WOR_2 bacterium RIFOXYA12_FULL_38_10]OGX55100.1 MAG: hypothetical protein A2447_02895 [Omnitrophica WOR_2 bacterium RIFOXYC2_FULL_38_12]OGX59135.1 MAG: hypothetical 